MSERVFISSTCYDLIDVRYELEEYLRDLGFEPHLSERPTSGFDVAPHESAVETCLINVESCEYVILILDQRYGGRLDEEKYGGISTTHLEYRRAVELGKHVVFLVRDRLLGDYERWRRDGGTTLPSGVWTQTDADAQGLFALIGEREQEGGRTSNWREVFTSVVDLKATVGARLRASSLKAATRRLLDWPDAPWITATKVSGNTFAFVNVGRTPARNVELIQEKRQPFIGDLGAGVEARQTIDLRFDVASLVFHTVNGYRVEDTFEVGDDGRGSVELRYRGRQVLELPDPR